MTLTRRREKSHPIRSCHTRIGVWPLPSGLVQPENSPVPVSSQVCTCPGRAPVCPVQLGSPVRPAKSAPAWGHPV